MNHLKINQDNTRTETNVDDNALELIYQELKEVETHDQNTLIGRIEVKHGYEDAVNFLNGNYSKFRCISTETPYIRFIDSVMEQYLINRLISSNMECDGHGLTQANLDQIRQGYFFDSLKNNTEITKFPEFNRLTNFTNMNGSCFSGCTNLEEINLSNITSITSGSCLSSTKLLIVNLPNCTEINAGNVFYNCGSLTEFNAPALTTCKGTSMFRGCTSLITFNAPQLTSIGNINTNNNMFRDCSNLTTINAPNLEITVLPELFFYECNNLEHMNIDLSNITHVYNNACKNCSKLDLSGLSFEKITRIDSYAFYGCIIPETIDLSECERILGDAFHGCSNLVNVINTSKITSLGGNVFQDCTTLTTFDDFSNITEIGSNAFRGTKLSGSIDLSSLTTIGGEAFKGTKITNVINPINLTNMPSSIFNGCTELLSIGSLENVTNFTGNGNQFYGCTKLCGEIDLSGITNKPDLTGTFLNCSNVKRIKLGEIGRLGTRWHGYSSDRQAFNGCTSLHTLDIKSLEYLCFSSWIGKDSCTNLVNIIVRNTTPPPPSNEYSNYYPGPINITYFSPNPNCKIYVPDEVLNDYKNASYWSDVADYIFPLSQYTPMSVD